MTSVISQNSPLKNDPLFSIMSTREDQPAPVKRIKPQIAKEYQEIKSKGRPDFSILEQEFENGHKFYEPQFSDNASANVAFRETESQIQHEAAVNGQIMERQAEDFYDSFM